MGLLCGGHARADGRARRAGPVRVGRVGQRHARDGALGIPKGYGLLQGALAAVNAGGFSDFSIAWPAATMGRPNAPRAPLVQVRTGGGSSGRRRLRLVAGRLLAPGNGGDAELELSWGAPDWNGGYPSPTTG